MREIKFRGWDGEQWVYGDLLTSKPDDDLCYIRFTDEDGDTVCRAVDPRSVGEYTGLKDKNGKEIYEGDILKVHYCIQGIYGSADKYEDFITKVYYSPGSYLCEGGIGGHLMTVLAQEKTSVEVVGNLYGNPELLEETL